MQKVFAVIAAAGHAAAIKIHSDTGNQENDNSLSNSGMLEQTSPSSNPDEKPKEAQNKAQQDQENTAGNQGQGENNGSVPENNSAIGDLEQKLEQDDSLSDKEQKAKDDEQAQQSAEKAENEKDAAETVPGDAGIGTDQTSHPSAPSPRRANPSLERATWNKHHDMYSSPGLSTGYRFNGMSNAAAAQQIRNKRWQRREDKKQGKKEKFEKKKARMKLYKEQEKAQRAHQHADSRNVHRNPMHRSLLSSTDFVKDKQNEAKKKKEQADREKAEQAEKVESTENDLENPSAVSNNDTQTETPNVSLSLSGDGLNATTVKESNQVPNEMDALEQGQGAAKSSMFENRSKKVQENRSKKVQEARRKQTNMLIARRRRQGPPPLPPRRNISQQGPPSLETSQANSLQQVPPPLPPRTGNTSQQVPPTSQANSLQQVPPSLETIQADSLQQVPPTSQANTSQQDTHNPDPTTRQVQDAVSQALQNDSPATGNFQVFDEPLLTARVGRTKSTSKYVTWQLPSLDVSQEELQAKFEK